MRLGQCTRPLAVSWFGREGEIRGWNLTLNSQSWMGRECSAKFETLKETKFWKYMMWSVSKRSIKRWPSETVWNRWVLSSLAIIQWPFTKDHLCSRIGWRVGCPRASPLLDLGFTNPYRLITSIEGWQFFNVNPEGRWDLVSNMDDPTDYHTRRVAVAHTSVGWKEIAVASVHLSGGTKVSTLEWPRIEKYFQPSRQTPYFSGWFLVIQLAKRGMRRFYQVP